MRRVVLSLMLSAPALLATLACSAEPTQNAFQEFVKQRADELRASDVDPANKHQWQQRKELLRARLRAAWGEFPAEPCALEAQTLGRIERDGYRVERIVFQTMPQVWMTANAYVPTSAGSNRPVPAVLCVHGHWPGAKQDPVVQSRCIGLVKLGFFVLSVDAFGAGERGIEQKLGEYHGEMTGAMLFPIGRPLSGIQVYENMRAVDYLQTRPEVDSKHIGITGASGGGNQTMYAGGYDERFRCVVPTCSVGTYRAYLSAACCMCEVVPGGISFTEEGDLLGLSVDRGLMVTNATRDAFQFSVDQAKISLARANHIGTLMGAFQAKHTIIESPHHYNQPMREAMYGWMTLHLKGISDGSPIAEPSIQPEDPESIRCFPGNSRPRDFLTIPRFAFREGVRLLNERAENEDRSLLAEIRANQTGSQSQWLSRQSEKFAAVLGGIPHGSELRLEKEITPDRLVRASFDSEPGIRLSVKLDATQKQKTVVLLNLDQPIEQTLTNPLVAEMRTKGWRVMVPELRAVGRLALANDKIGNATDHNSAEWSLWIGRPLLGQWVVDVRRALDALEQLDGAKTDKIAVVGIGPAGLVALSSAAIDRRISHVVSINSLGSYVSDQPYRNQRLGLMVPNILRQVGDVGHIAAMVAPRSVLIAGASSGGGQSLDAVALRKCFDFTTQIFSAMAAPEQFRIVEISQISDQLDR